MDRLLAMFQGLTQPVSHRADQSTTQITVSLVEKTTQHTPEEVDLAVDVHKFWRTRIKDIIKAIDLYTRTMETIMDRVLTRKPPDGCEDSSHEEYIQAIFENLQRVNDHKNFCQDLLKTRHVEPLGHFGRQDENPDDEFNFKDPIIEIFTEKDILKLSEIERDCYQIFVIQAIPILQKVQYVKRTLMNIINEVLHQWDSGEPKDVIKTNIVNTIQEKLAEYVIDTTQSQLHVYAQRLLISATAHKPERIRLSANQIEMLLSDNAPDEMPEEHMCAICQENILLEDAISTPCCQQMMHKNCATETFKRRANCIYCRKDLRLLLVLPESEDTQQMEIDEEDNEEGIPPLLRENAGMGFNFLMNPVYSHGQVPPAFNTQQAQGPLFTTIQNIRDQALNGGQFDQLQVDQVMNDLLFQALGVRPPAAQAPAQAPPPSPEEEEEENN